MIGLGLLSALVLAPVSGGPANLPDFVTKATDAIARRDARFLDNFYAIRFVTDDTESKDGEFLLNSLSNCTQQRVFGGKSGTYYAQYLCAAAGPPADRNHCISLLIDEWSIRMLGCMPVMPPVLPWKPERGN